MTPIISPWVFYLIGFVENATIFCGIVIAVIMFLWFGNWLSSNGEYRPRKPVVALVSFLTILMVVMPSESTLTKMIVAQNVTDERVEMVGDTVQDVYEDIISLVDGNNENVDTEE